MNTRPFFWSPERILALRFHAGELVDTPFVPHAMVPGSGIDCIGVNAWCYLKTGFLKDFKPPRYALDSGQHATESALLKWLDARTDFLRLPRLDSGLAAGDTICFNLGLSEHHVGLVLNDSQFIHVLPRRRVLISSFAESYYSRKITAAYQPTEIPTRGS